LQEEDQQEIPPVPHITPVSPNPCVPVTRIRGALGDKVLRKSPELFNQGLPTVLAEVLQNARRAGATRVGIELLGEEGRATLAVRDDGHGITDMARLVTFGASAWDERTDLVENAAGMGVFSLASRGVTVRSRGQRVTLSRAVFCGEAEAAVLPDPEMVVGTELLFPVVERAVERACRFYPLPVTLNGRPQPQPGFLEGAEHVVEWQGLRLGVFREVGPKVLDLFDRHRGWDRRLYLNFHGHVVECGAAVALAEVGGPTRNVFVDVVSAPDLRLVLPVRNEPIDNDFFRAMRARAERALLEAVALGTTHSLPFDDARRAKAMGIELPSVRIPLTPWRLNTDVTRHRIEELPGPVVLGTPGTEVLLTDALGIEQCSAMNLDLILRGWSDRPRVVVADSRFEGYREYDTLRVVRAISAVATDAEGSDEEFPGSTIRSGSAPQDAEYQVVETLSARLMVAADARKWAQPAVMHEAAVPFFFTDEPSFDGMPSFVVVRGTEPGDLSDALVEGFFAENEDVGNDSSDRQLEAFSAEARDLSRTLLLDGDAATAARIVEHLRNIRWELRSLQKGSIELHIVEDQIGSTIRIVGPSGREVTAIL
ncbi:ATP-binding protein, partial [Roseomonas mucosa]|uniref:ATP-binding protein n=1 Tax=Roseomonas mucosa TaxID=207340 RepID=UPI0012DC1E99